ncbi:MAG: PqqD family protein [Chloroflexi bacterium]|nr:PqqD family protein [Chloroflexota bacterium]
MTRKQTPRIVPGLIWRKVDDNSVVVSPQSGKIRALNGVGSTIWQLVAEENSVDAIVEQLTVQYAVSPEQAAGDLQTFLADLDTRGLIEWEN